MKRMRRLAAVLVALGGTISATVTYAGGYDRWENQRAASPAELSRLAAELADTAARLAALEKQQAAKDLSSAENSGSTVRWLTDQEAGQTLESENFYAEAPKVLPVGEAAPRPAVRAFQEGPTAWPAPTNSTIIRIQATDDVLSAAPEPTPWGDSLLSGDSCCDTCCDSCCDTGCDPGCGCAKCKPRRIMVVSTEAVFLDADINGNRIEYLFDDFVASEGVGFGPAFGDAAIDDFYVAPRLTVGIQGERWGIQGRYFHMRVGEHAHDPVVPEGAFPLDSFDVNSIFEAYYTDIELTRNFCLHGCKNQFSFGARYAAIEHHESLYARSFSDLTVPTDPLIIGYGRSNREAYGTGMTFGLTGRKPLFCNACANWFYSARGSILWGPTKNEVETEARASGTGASAASIDTATALVDDDLFIGELQAGLEWDFALRCLPAKAFFRAAFEYQYWDASSGYAASTSFAGIDDTTPDPDVDWQGTVNAEAPGLIVDLLGFHIGTGFTW